MKRFLLLATAMLLVVSCGDGASKKEAPAESAPKVEAAPAKVELPKVYSNCYDGYLNVRSQPTTNSQILGELRNGPEGAELLGVEGKWSKVRVNGIEGYVSSNYLQSTPTDPVHINAAAVIGTWYNEEFIGGNWYDKITINSNGKFVHEMWMGVDMNDKTTGAWSLSRNNLVLRWADGDVTVCAVNGKSLNIGGGKFIKL